MQMWLQKAEVEVSMCQNCFGCLVIFEDDVSLDIVFIIVHVLLVVNLNLNINCTWCGYPVIDCQDL